MSDIEEGVKEVKAWLAVCGLSDIEEGVEVMPAIQYHKELKMAKAREGGRRSRPSWRYVDGGGGRDLAGGIWKEEEVKT